MSTIDLIAAVLSEDIHFDAGLDRDRLRSSPLLERHINSRRGVLSDQRRGPIMESTAHLISFTQDIISNPTDPSTYAIMADFLDERELGGQYAIAFLKQSQHMPAAARRLLEQVRRFLEDNPPVHRPDNHYGMPLPNKSITSMLENFAPKHAAMNRLYSRALRESRVNVSIMTSDGFDHAWYVRHDELPMVVDEPTSVLISCSGSRLPIIYRTTPRPEVVLGGKLVTTEQCIGVSLVALYAMAHDPYGQAQELISNFTNPQYPPR